MAYINAEGKIKYAFSVLHGLLQIKEAFSVILNSGQIWKFADWSIVKNVVNTMTKEEWQGTNLVFVEKYFSNISEDKREIIAIREWENCNTRNDYLKSLELL